MVDIVLTTARHETYNVYSLETPPLVKAFLLGIPRHRNVKKKPKLIGWGFIDQLGLDQLGLDLQRFTSTNTYTNILTGQRNTGFNKCLSRVLEYTE